MDEATSALASDLDLQNRGPEPWNSKNGLYYRHGYPQYAAGWLVYPTRRPSSCWVRYIEFGDTEQMFSMPER